MIKLSNGARIYTYGKPNLFLLGGVHGEERASAMALMHTLSDNLKNVWILPCLNKQGYEELNRLCGKKNLNEEFEEDTTLPFMHELMNILKENKPKIFVDMHEDVDASNAYIWTHFFNEKKIEKKVRAYCKANDIGLTYQPDVDEYYYSTKGTSQSFAHEIGVPSSYTTETMQYAPFDKRLKQNREYINFFLSIKD